MPGCTGDRKVTEPIPDTHSICQKTNSIEIRKYQVLEMPTAFSYASINSLPQVDGIDSADEILSIYLAQENR